MCFNAPTSIITFAISLSSCVYLYNIEKKNKTNKFCAIVIILIGLMQLLEFFLWKNQSCNLKNHIFSLLILVIITLQPIVIINYYNYLFKPTLFNTPSVIGYSILYTVLSIYILNKLNKFKLCSRPTQKSCRLNWDVFNKLGTKCQTFIKLLYIFFYFIPLWLVALDAFKNNNLEISKYPIRYAFLPVTFLVTLIFVCIKKNINPINFFQYSDIWGTMWCFMAVFLGIVAILKI